MTTPKLGLICRADNSGLGTLSREFYDHLDPERVLLITNEVYRTFPERFAKPGKDMPRIYKRSEFDDAAIRSFLKGLDVVMAFETPYNWNVFTIAREMGVKTILMPMFEMQPLEPPAHPDAYCCPSLLDYDEFKGKVPARTVAYIPVPVNLERLKRRRPTVARTFVHNAGHGGVVGRNGTGEFLEAVKRVRSKNVRFVVNAQFPLEVSDPRVTVNVCNFREYWQLWQHGDVFVFPHKFDGLSLPIQEALATGMPILTTGFYPFTKMLPEEFLFPYRTRRPVKLERPIEMFMPSPDDIAAAIDAMAALPDIGYLSDKARAVAEAISWEKLLPTYKALIQNVCQK